jgi:molybdopterin converting factor small subunit
MKSIKYIPFLLLSVLFFACSNETVKETEEEINPDFCACMNPTAELTEKCATLYPVPQTEEEKRKYAQQEADCIENSDINQFSQQEETQPTEETAVEAEEEELEPVSPECEKFVSEYGAAVKSFTALAKKAQANPDDINLKIQYMNSSEEIGTWASKPMMFECSQNKAFKKKIEELNTTRDKLLSN